MALPPQALILQSGTDPRKVLLGVNPFDSFRTWRESTDPTFSNSLAYFTPSPCEYAKLWAWFTEMDVQSISNGPAMELARVKWEMSVND